MVKVTRDQDDKQMVDVVAREAKMTMKITVAREARITVKMMRGEDDKMMVASRG